MENNQDKNISIFRIIIIFLSSYSIALLGLMILVCAYSGFTAMPGGESCVSINREISKFIMPTSIFVALIGGLLGCLWKIDKSKISKGYFVIRVIISVVVFLGTILATLLYISSTHAGYPLIKIIYYLDRY